MEDELSTSNGTLKDLLNSGYYLGKILGHVVDDGIHECRLVCRKWYDICSHLPVQLVRVPVTKLPVVVDRFPNATALSLHSHIKWNDETAEALPSLAQLTSLRSIQLHGVNGLSDNDLLPFYDLLGEALQSCHELQGFATVPVYDVRAGICLYSHLNNLTGLTHLRLPGGWEQLVSDPFTDVRNIEDLEIQSVCLDDGQLVFPSLTHLTQLRVSLDGRLNEDFREAFQKILPYASSLQGLDITTSSTDSRHELVKIPWVFLSEFRQLSSVSFSRVTLDEVQDFCAAIGCLNLTHLQFDRCLLSNDFVETLAGVRSLTSLRSLWLNFGSDYVYKIFPSVPHLTSLRVCDLNDIELLTVLTALKDLEFSARVQTNSRLSHVFSHMPNLETLVLKDGDRQMFSDYCLSHLKELRSISFDCIFFEEGIFRTLAQLPGLTKLLFCECFLLLPFDQWSEINSLTNLERLELWASGRSYGQISALMEGKLSKLRYLSLYYEHDDRSDQWRRLHQSLPSLRQCFLRELTYGDIVYPEEF